MDLERNLRRLATVPRWVVVPTIKQQSVAEHTFHVVWICRWLHTKLNSAHLDLATLLLITIDHDSEEATTGDTPSPSKPLDIHEVYGKEKCVLKIADILEAMLFVREEVELGNRSMGPILINLTESGGVWVDRARQVGLLKTPSIEALFDHLWSKVRPDLHPALTDKHDAT